jgi:tRNA threonylcarbamoyladenosine biosynthesis protein TsaE
MKYSLSEIDETAQYILKNGSGLKVLCFEGEMGAGKTTLIKAICKELNVVDEMSSPTFNIVNEYQDNNGSSVYHFDFYRIENTLEAVNIGTEEYFYSNDYCLIEWPDKVSALLPDQYLKININLVDQNQREISIALHDGKE